MRARSPDAPTTTTVREDASQSTGGRPYVRRSPVEGVAAVLVATAVGGAAAVDVVVGLRAKAREGEMGGGLVAGVGRRLKEWNGKGRAA